MANDTAREVDVTTHDLPLHCPLPGSPLWARHPRVFLDVVNGKVPAHADWLAPV